MSRIEDMKAALECREPRTVPLWEIEFHGWDWASGRHLVIGHEFQNLSASEQDRVLHQNAELIAGVAEELGFAGVTVPGGYWEVAPGEPAHYWLPVPARYRQIEILRQVAGGRFLVVAEAGGVITPPITGNQFVEFCYKLFDAPEEIDTIAQRCLEHGREGIKRMRDLGVDAVFTASDIADNHGPVFNPEQMDRFVLPYLRQWAEAVRKAGMYAIMHSDGNLTPCLDALAGSGLHALQAIDPIAGMNIRAAKQTVAGRLCLCGNVDCGLLLTGTPAAVSEATRSLLSDCAAGGGLVLGASNAVQAEVPRANYMAMIEAWRSATRKTSG